LKIITGDSLHKLKSLPNHSIHCCVTSPPYWGLRDYGVAGQLGLENTPEEFVASMVGVFHEVKRVLRRDGTLWLNIGDSYAGSGKGQSSNGENDPKKNKTRGMKVPVHRASSVASSTLQGGKRTQSGALRAHENGSTPNLKPKDLVGIPWMLAFALRADGWYLRQDIIWHKPNPMPESVTDRCTKAHEYIFLLSKSPHYYYDQRAIKEPASTNTHARLARAAIGHKSNPDQKRNGIRPRKLAAAGSGTKQNTSFDAAMCEVVNERNKRSVWCVGSKPYKGAHFATFPPDLIEPCILAGAPIGGAVLDPFMGSGTTGYVALKHQRDFVGIELNPAYVKLAMARIATALIRSRCLLAA
jgi:DNA modification methylase